METPFMSNHSNNTHHHHRHHHHHHHHNPCVTTCLGPEPIFDQVEDYRIVILGPCYSGKTSLCYQFVCNRFVSDFYATSTSAATTTTSPTITTTSNILMIDGGGGGGARMRNYLSSSQQQQQQQQLNNNKRKNGMNGGSKKKRNMMNRFRTRMRMEEGICHLELIDLCGLVIQQDNSNNNNIHHHHHHHHHAPSSMSGEDDSQYAEIRDRALREADGFIIMFDITDFEQSFHQVEQTMHWLMSSVKRDMMRPAIVLAANKSSEHTTSDYHYSSSYHGAVDDTCASVDDNSSECSVTTPYEHIESFAKKWSVPWIDLSVREKRNVTETFQCAVIQIRNRRPAAEYIIPTKRGGCTIL